MRIAIVTPYCTEPLDWLEAAHASVRAQRPAATHVLVADGNPQAAVDSWDAVHLVLPAHSADEGCTPRAVGTAYAAGRGFDAIGYLDADNWYEPDHLATMVELTSAGVPVGVGRLTITSLDGRHSRTDGGTKAQAYADTNTLFVTRRAFPALAIWGLMPDRLKIACDRFVWFALKAQGHAHAEAAHPTVRYRSNHLGFYQDMGLPAPPGAKDIGPRLQAAQDWWNGLAEPERLDWSRRMGLAR